MVVGDADQSIYAFRGANIRNILDFEQDFPNATSILLEQNYRSTQTILNAANSVIGHNKGRKPKRLWSDAGDGERIVGYVADDEHDEARFVSEEIDKLTDEGGARAGRRRGVLPHQRPVPGVRGGLHPGRHALQGRRRRAVLRAPRGPRRARLPADAGQPGRRDLAAPGPEHPQARHRRPGVECVQALADRDRILFWEALRRAEDAPGLATRSLKAIQGFVGMVDELQSMVDAGERPDVILESVLARSGYLAELEASDDPQDETRVENLAELVAVAREFSDDPRRRAVRRPGRRRRRHRRPRPLRLPGAGRAGRRRRPDPRRPGGRRRRRGHADDAAHREGPGVPGRVPDRPRGRRLPARPVAGRPARARGGAPAGVRRRHPRPAAALRLPGGRPLRLGRAVAQPGVPVPRRAAGRPRRLAAYRGRADPVGPARPGQRLGRVRLGTPTAAGRRNFSSAALKADAASKAKPAGEIPSLEPGDRVVHDSFGMGTVVALEGVAEKAVASIDFGSEGVKRLLLRYAPVEKLRSTQSPGLDTPSRLPQSRRARPSTARCAVRQSSRDANARGSTGSPPPGAPRGAGGSR